MTDDNSTLSEQPKERRKSDRLTDVVRSEVGDLRGDMKKYFRNRSIMALGKPAIIIAVLLAISFMPDMDKRSNHIALINLDGAVTTGSETGDGMILSERLQDALDNEKAKVVVVYANSPGGSPSHAEMFYETIMEYRRKRDAGEVEDPKQILFSISDVCASACVYMASAADRIYSHESSIVGSIGVKMEGFAYVGLMEKLGVERRTLSLGDHKTMLSPYLPIDKEAEGHMKSQVLAPAYNQFKNALIKARPGKIDPNNKELFQGLVWAGPQAIEQGLVDEIKTSYHLIEDLKDEYDADRTFVYNPRKTKDMMSQFLTGSVDLLVDRIFTRLNAESDVKIVF